MKKLMSTSLLLGLLGSFCEAQLPLLQTEGTYIIKEGSQEKIILKGIDVSNNVWGFYEWPVSDSLEKAKVNPLIRAKELKPFVFTSEDVDRIALLKGNAVRYCFNDELFRESNPKRIANLSVMKNHIAQLAAKGIYSIVTMQINPGLDVHNDNFERTKPGNKRLLSPFESDSVFALWCETWEFVAAGLKEMNEVAGYELINEPKRPALADADETKLVTTYTTIIDSIRSKDNRHIIFVPEFNSREANPGEDYWSDEAGKFVTDKGEQGTIWGRNWLKLPKTLDNLVYTAHIYDPYEFTSGKKAGTFDAERLTKIVNETAEWAYNENKPLYVSEYGVNYYHTFNGNDDKRTEWLKTMHEAFDNNHISSTIWQYKELITPWVKMEETFGIWLHYYDTSTIKSVTGGKVEYSNEQARQAAVDSKIDPILNSYFIEGEKFRSVSMVNNQSLFDELNRYFSAKPLGVKHKSMLTKTIVFFEKDLLHFKNLPLHSGPMPVKILNTNGQMLADTILHVQNGMTEMKLNQVIKPADKLVIINYGRDEKFTSKVYIP